VDDLTLASLMALVSESLDVYALALHRGLTPSEAHRYTVGWAAVKAETLEMVHGAMLEGARRVITNIPNILGTLLAEVWPADVDSAHLVRLTGKLKARLPEALVINLF